VGSRGLDDAREARHGNPTAPAGEAQIPRHIAGGQRLEIDRGAPLNLMTTLLRIN